MDSLLKQPNPMLMKGDLAINWKSFKQLFNIYMTASNGNALPAERRAALLLHVMGPEALNILDSFQLTETEMVDPKTIIERFDQYFIPKTNISIERHKFHSRVQAPNESFEEFQAELTKMAVKCNFGNLKDELIKDRILCGIRDIKLKNRLLSEDNFDLNKMAKICKAAEETLKHMSALQPEIEVNELRRHKNRESYRQQNAHPKSTYQEGSYQPNNGRRNMQKNGRVVQYGKSRTVCSKCGYKHPYSKCPAYGVACNKCKQKNHFAKRCDIVKELHNIQSSESAEQEELVLSVNCPNNINKDWYAVLYVAECNSDIKFKIDTGAHINVLPECL